MKSLPEVIIEMREVYVNEGLAETYKDINCGICVEFSEEVESAFTDEIELINNDFFMGEDGWNGKEDDVWVQESLKEYNAELPEGVEISDLGKIVKGYHQWIFDGGKHYDSECPDGVKNPFHLPFFKRHFANCSVK